MLLALLLLASPVDDARAKYVRGDYDGALTAVEAGLAADGPPSERARLHVLRGVALAQRGDATAARAAFDAALALDACAALPEGVAPPDDVRASFAAARAQAPTCPRPARGPAWPLAAGVGVAAAGGVALVAGAVMGGLAATTNASANAALVQSDAVLLDGASRDQANVANALYALGAVLVVGGGAAVAVTFALE